MILPNGTTVAVADGRTLLLFRNRAHEPDIDLEPLEVPQIEGDTRGSGARHRSSSANPDDARLGEDGFAAAAADHLNRQALGGHIERLFVIADPRTLGELRRHFHGVLASRVVGDLAKDLVDRSVGEIEAALRRA
ncbi:host attachment family protein [Methylobrevis pamukkalensis]|uniref:Hypothetivcal protein n=1 Tax=Methylobrevis pamukkalensis TaxID=1439726 RepID=A0A1E3H8W2_9HYPH|nr:host attachment protein [Methylobrevis pamukkalensis]ODN72236.1 hypothetivcal protein [Methylobrevis pamukkalensis]